MALNLGSVSQLHCRSQLQIIEMAADMHFGGSLILRISALSSLLSFFPTPLQAVVLRKAVTLPAEVWPDAMMVRYCLCCVVRPVCVELAQLPDSPFKPAQRRALFDALCIGSEEGSLGELLGIVPEQGCSANYYSKQYI